MHLEAQPFLFRRTSKIQPRLQPTGRRAIHSSEHRQRYGKRNCRLFFSNQTQKSGLLSCTCWVTTGRNEDVGRGAFFRFLPATPTHRYALTTNSFPVCASSRKESPATWPGLFVLVLYLRDNFKNHGLQVAHVNLTFAWPSGPALTASRFVRPCQLRVVSHTHPSPWQ